MPENKEYSLIVKQRQTVNFLDTLRALQAKEWKDLNLPIPKPGQCIDLPDSREDILSRLWIEICNSRHGNQEFTNDTLCYYVFPSVNGEELSDDQQALYDFCKPAITNETIIFDVSW